MFWKMLNWNAINYLFMFSILAYFVLMKVCHDKEVIFSSCKINSEVKLTELYKNFVLSNLSLYINL